VSKKLGDKMLLGWTLMDSHCPNENCACPFMKDKKGVLLCVSCDTKYIKKGESELVEVTDEPKQMDKERGKQKNKKKNEWNRRKRRHGN